MSRIEPLSEVRKGHIRQVLDHVQGDMEMASRILGVTPEDLQHLLTVHGLERPLPAAQPHPNHEEE